MLLQMEVSKVVKDLGHLRMIGPDQLLSKCQGLLQAVLSFSDPAERSQGLCQVVQRGGQ